MSNEILDELVIPAQDAISVYSNDNGGIVLRAYSQDMTHYVIFDADYADRMIDAIERVKREIKGDAEIPMSSSWNPELIALKVKKDR